MGSIKLLSICLAICVLALVGCSGGEKTVVKTTWEKDFSSHIETGDASKSEDAEQKESQVELPDVSNCLPYVGMPAELIDATGIGTADEVGEKLALGKFAGAVPHYWRAKNGTGDLVFSAYVKDGEVVSVAKYNTGKNYWGVSATSSGLPDLYASGEAVEKITSQSAKPDPDGWDDPEDYANDNAGAFDSYDAAYDYWLEEMT